MKKAIAMKCTQENWDSIKDMIPEDRIYSVTSFEKYPWIFVDKTKQISNIKEGGYWEETWKRVKVVHETFSAKIFLEACGIETDVYEITKETVIKYNMKDEFPYVFKTELVAGFWYKSETKHGLFKNMFKTDDGINIYGFINDEWFVSDNIHNVTKRNLSEATPQEVESALICEAKKRGYKDGDLIYSKWAGGCTLNHKEPYLKNNELWFGDCRIFVDGIWAEIAEKMTLSQIEKELGRKIELV